MPLSTFEWQLSEIQPGSEIVVKDRQTGHLVVRGILLDDGLSVASPTGERLDLRGHPEWKIVVVHPTKGRPKR